MRANIRTDSYGALGLCSTSAKSVWRPITTKISQETLAEIIGSINSAGSASNRLRPPLSGSSQYQASRPQPRHLLRCMSPVMAVRPEGANHGV